VRTAVRTIAPLKPENGGNWWSSAVVSVRVKSLVEGTIGNQWSRPVSEGKCPGQNWGSRGREFKSGQPDKNTLVDGDEAWVTRERFTSVRTS
jgi:hypothetical protein